MLLRKMRKKVKVIMWFTLLLIVPAFIWWGIGSTTASRKNLLAKVDGIPITLDQFSQAFNLLYNRYALLFSSLGEDEFREKIRGLNIEKQTFSFLIENILLQREIKKRQIKISDDEVAGAIRKEPFFLNPDGAFDKGKFTRAIENVPEGQWQIWEDQVRSRLALEKLKNQIIAQAAPGDKETAYAAWLSNLKSQAKIVQKNELPELVE